MCLRKAPGIVAAWHSRAARKHLLQIRAPLKCFTKSALSSPIVPRATQLTGHTSEWVSSHPCRLAEAVNHGVILLFTLRGCRGIIFLMDEIAVCVTVVGI